FIIATIVFMSVTPDFVQGHRAQEVTECLRQSVAVVVEYCGVAIHEDPHGGVGSGRSGVPCPGRFGAL
ncbi:MAG: hypothetical protein ABSH41_22015, partial [Syntrophobacteraceae bacterium]